VSDEDESLVPEVLHELAHVLHKRAREVGVYVLRLGGEVVATEVGCHREMVARELA
jgi:hypothetical protein